MNTIKTAITIMKAFDGPRNIISHWENFLEDNTYLFDFLNVDVYLVKPRYIGGIQCALKNIMIDPYLNVICFNADLFEYSDMLEFISTYDYMLYHEIGHVLDPNMIPHLIYVNKKRTPGKTREELHKEVYDIELEYFADNFAANMIGPRKCIQGIETIIQTSPNKDGFTPLHARRDMMIEMAKLRKPGYDTFV